LQTVVSVHPFVFSQFCWLLLLFLLGTGLCFIRKIWCSTWGP